MKVGDFLKKYKMCSNLNNGEVKELRPDRLMDMTVQSFSIIDNVLTIYAMDKGQGGKTWVRR